MTCQELRQSLSDLRHLFLRIKCEIAAQRFKRAGWSAVQVLGKFHPDQPRDGQGRWTNTDGDVVLVGGYRRTFVPVRVGNRALAATPAQADRLAYAVARARQTLEQVREYEPAWRPTPSLSDPNTVEGAIRGAEAEVAQAQARLNELLRPRSNGGPPLDATPVIGTGTSTPLPPICIATYRSITGMPNVGERLAVGKEEGTVAFTTIDGRPVYGVNSDAPGFTVADHAAAREMRADLVDRYPDVMATDNLGWKPNDALYHAEANLLQRAASASGGTLAGRSIDVSVDRSVCPSCDRVLPILGLRLGNPVVRFRDSLGRVKVMKNGNWVE